MGVANAQDKEFIGSRLPVDDVVRKSRHQNDVYHRPRGLASHARIGCEKAEELRQIPCKSLLDGLSGLAPQMRRDRFRVGQRLRVEGDADLTHLYRSKKARTSSSLASPLASASSIASSSSGLST